MCASKRLQPDHPGWTVIRSAEDLEEHDPHDPAYLLIPPALVRPIWLWLKALTHMNQIGELCRGVELLLVGLGEPDGTLMMSATKQIMESLEQLVLTARVLSLTGEVEILAAGEDEADGVEAVKGVVVEEPPGALKSENALAAHELDLALKGIFEDMEFDQLLEQLSARHRLELPEEE